MNNNVNISEEELHEIESYLRQEVSEKKRKHFEARLADDPQWQQKVRQVELMIVGIKETAISEKLRSLDHKPAVRVRTMKPKRKAFAPYIVAAVVIGLIFSVLLLIGVFKSDDDKLFAQFYRPDSGLITAMSVTDEYNFEVAMVDYKSENYEAAIQRWKALADTEGENDTLSYFIGSAYLASDKVPEAFLHFKKVLENNQSTFYHDAQWYYGLALIKAQRPLEAIPYIAGSNHEDKEKLLKKLRTR